MKFRIIWSKKKNCTKKSYKKNLSKNDHRQKSVFVGKIL